ncbi:MAG: SDR family NAD(P)-dependent oxidoreductase, partial [Gammaproteobacteria bacterium]|nr:SDR family NAD(P)-dependent oxidoreductase [Gammaproteobacteria bacterium]
MGTLEGKVALVTGGTGGIGTAICQRLASEGARIVTTYMNEEKAKAWQSEQSFDASIFACDVSDYEACVALKAATESEVGPVDIVVNNAGITRDASFKKMTAEKWAQVIATNLDSVFNITHQFVNDMAGR